MEMSFATGEDVMNTVESIIAELPQHLNSNFRLVGRDGRLSPVDICAIVRFIMVVSGLSLPRSLSNSDCRTPKPKKRM
jgi:hypothetical protein